MTMSYINVLPVETIEIGSKIKICLNFYKQCLFHSYLFMSSVNHLFENKNWNQISMEHINNLTKEM